MVQQAGAVAYVRGNASSSTTASRRGMVICQGDIYWIDLGQPIGSEPGYVRPYVVIQNDVLNSSRIRTVIV